MFPLSPHEKLTWKEPWLFQLRTSGRTAWLIRGAFFVAVYVLFVVALNMEEKSPKGRTFRAAEKLVLPAVVAATFLALFELPNAQRIVSVTDAGVSCVGALMMFGGLIQLITGMRHWNWREIKQIQLLRPGEPGNTFSFGLMIVTPKYASARRIAVSSTILLNEVADHFHAMGVDVHLSDWRPTEQHDA